MENLFNLIDQRLSQRANFSFSKIATRSAESLPNIFNEYADLEDFYRLIKNPRLSMTDLMSCVAKESLTKIKDEAEVAVIHDTTYINPQFNIGKNTLGKRGLLSHLSLLTSTGNSCEIFGALGLITLGRNEDGTKSTVEKESFRWFAGIEAAEENIASPQKAIHLMDREGDIYELLCSMNDLSYRYVIRVSTDRKISDEHAETVFEKIKSKKSILSLSCKISKREPTRFSKHNKIHPRRDARDVILNVSADRVNLKRPAHQLEKHLPKNLEINLVRIWEESPPEGEAGIEWFLYTSEKLETPEDVEKVVSLYRRRWLIEEFFKGLKTGCNLEKKQFSDIESWKKLIVFYLPVAVKILNLRVIDQVALNSVKACLTEDQIKILEHVSKKSIKTTTEAQSALASLGGHIKYNGPPGWQVLYRGWEKLLMLEAGWKLRCDYL
jgi:hypothetical protein